MLASKTPEELEKLKELGLDKPVDWDLGHGKPIPKSTWLHDHDGDFGNPADDVLDLTPLLDERVQPDDLAVIADHFSRALVWASEAKSPVEMGWRLSTMMRLMRPALIEGMQLEVKLKLCAELRRSVGLSNLAKVGEHYAKDLEWCRCCTSLSQMGMRGFALLYVLRRDLLGELGTNAAIAALQNKTRQAFNRLVQSYRDMRNGFRNGVMRSQITRARCRRSQLKRKPRGPMAASVKQHAVEPGDRRFGRLPTPT